MHVYLGNKQLLQLKDENVKSVEDVWCELGEDEEDEVEVEGDGPLQPVLVHLTGKRLINHSDK